LAALGDALRDLSTAAIMLHQAVADRLGLNVTDHKCAGILCRTGPISAGELAERTGLTTGAITGVIDRLEKAGFVRRARDPKDRRRVIVEPFPERIEREIGPLFASLAGRVAELCAGYTVEELGLILDFTRRSSQVSYEETRKLREGNATDEKAGADKGKRQTSSTLPPLHGPVPPASP
jgi:DNA-binding MarR family transcriptional regulator